MHVLGSTGSSVGHYGNIAPLLYSEVRFCDHKILPLNHILNHLNHVRTFKICLRFLCWCFPSIYVFSILWVKTTYAFIIPLPLYAIFWTIWIKYTSIFPLIKICFHFVLRCTTVFPNYIFPPTTVYVILVLCYYVFSSSVLLPFILLMLLWCNDAGYQTTHAF